MLPICLSAVYLLAIPPSVFFGCHSFWLSVRPLFLRLSNDRSRLSLWMSVRSSVSSPSVCLSLWLFFRLFGCLSFQLPVCSSYRLSVCPSIWLSVHLSVSFASVCLFDCPLAVLDVCPFVCLFGRLFVKWRGQNSTTLSSFLEKILKHCQQVIQSKVCYFVKKQFLNSKGPLLSMKGPNGNGSTQGYVSDSMPWRRLVCVIKISLYINLYRCRPL